MKSFYWSEKTGALDYEDLPYEVNSDEFIDRHIGITTNKFHIGQSYETAPASVLQCNLCGSDKFLVSQSPCFTAIKCPNCGYEICIHKG